MAAGNTVAVVGLGALGLVAVKNLVEEGFDVTGFDQNPFVGGLWHYADDDRVSVLPSTVINISKERGCFTDFPFPEDAASYLNAPEVERYLESYVDHFGLRPKLRLETRVTKISRNEGDRKWILQIENSSGQRPENFDRVVVATGINQIPNIPAVEGIDIFEGETLHSRAFKQPQRFTGKRVLVVGLGNTGADTATSLIGHAKSIHVSFNHGTYVLPRLIDGKPIDHSITLQMINLQGLMERYIPSISERVFNSFVAKLQNKAFTIRPEWGISPAPSLKNGVVPVISDTIVSALESKAVLPVVGLKRVNGPRSVELKDGTILEVDTIIFCTGYQNNFSLVQGEFDPTAKTTPEWAKAPFSNGRCLPRLYQNVFSLEAPDSLAFLGGVAYPAGAFQIYDLVAMVITQVWAGKSSLPPVEEMAAHVNRRHAQLCRHAQTAPVNPSFVSQSEWISWANPIAGTGLDVYLGWGWEAWKLWWKDPELYRLLAKGLFSPHIFRALPGKRKQWDGAREELIRINQAVKNIGKK